VHLGVFCVLYVTLEKPTHKVQMSNYLKSALVLCTIFMGNLLFAQTDIRLAMQTDNWADAVKHYEAATKSAPTNVENFLRLGSIYQALGQDDKAKASYGAAMSADPKNKLCTVIEVRQAIMSGDAAAIDKSVKKAEKAARGKDVDLLRLLGESFLYGAKKNLPEAEKWLKEAYTAKPKDSETLMQLGYAYRNMTNRLGDAVSNYEFASNLNGTDPLPYYLQSKAYWVGRNPAKYEEFLQKALAAEPTYVPALRDVADYQYFKRKYTEARTSYEKLLEAQGATPLIEDEMQYTNTLFYLKDYDAVVTQVNKIIGKDGSKNYLRRLLGYTYFEKGDTDKGLDVMRDYFQKVSADKIIARDYEYYGKMLAAKKEDSLALVNLTKAVQMDSSIWQAYSEIGKIKFGQRDYVGSAAAYQIRLDSLGTEATSADYYTIGLAYYFAKDFVGAEKNFLAVTEKSPKYASGWLYLAKTQAKADPDVEANPALAIEFGKAEVAFAKFIEVAGAETDAAKLQKSKDNRIEALQYLAYMHITKGNKEAGCGKLNEILVIDPTNQNALDFKLATSCP
jgi:tetratricopeptide (TPR) repeat protein